MSRILDLKERFGGIDIYLFDQLLKGRLDECSSIFDAGCGDGRNLTYFLRSGFDVHAIDRSPKSIEMVRRLAQQISPTISTDNFRIGNIEDLPYPHSRFDFVISNAVLHFAENEEHFSKMLNEMWRVLKEGGVFFSRLASTIGLEQYVKRVEGNRYKLPDGTERYLIDHASLLDLAKSLGAELLDPIKTTNVENQRCMTTWCLRKPRTH